MLLIFVYDEKRNFELRYSQSRCDGVYMCLCDSKNNVKQELKVENEKHNRERKQREKKTSSKHLNLHKQIHIHISEFLFCHVAKYMANDIRSEKFTHHITQYNLEQKPEQ